MKPIFVDTSALIAIGNQRDTFHKQAIRVKNELINLHRNYVITNAILLEFGNAFSQVNLKSTAIQLIEIIEESNKWKCINIDNELMQQGFELYKKMQDKDWGFVDCTSIVVSKEMGVTEVFTTDHHFEQAGFNILLNK